MLAFQICSMAVWPALLLLLSSCTVDAARGLLKNARTIRRIVHVNKHNSSGPIPSFEFGENDDMQKLYHFGEPMEKDLGCHPRCVWHCTDPVCDKTCEPVCEAPKCETRCPQMDERLCGEDCSSDPDCVVICPKEQRCTKEECPPQCKTECGTPTCKIHCGAVPCHSLCEDPHCEWVCKDPENCPKPECRMQCEQPKGCLAGSLEVPLPEPVDSLVVGQAMAKLEGVPVLEDAKPKGAA